METKKGITKSDITKQIAKSLTLGQSDLIETDDSNSSYLRLIVSQYNTKFNTKISTKRVSPCLYVLNSAVKHSVDMDVISIIDQMITNVDMRIGKEQHDKVVLYLNNIITMCNARVLKADAFAVETTKASENDDTDLLK